MLSRASLIANRVGVRSISGAEFATAGVSFGGTIGTIVAIVGGMYAIDSKNESRMNHLDSKIDTLTQSVNTLAVTIARNEQVREKKWFW